MTSRRVRTVCRTIPNPRFVVERHEKEHDELEGIYKAKIAKAQEKKAEKVTAAFRRFVWFVVGSHILMVIEYIWIWRRVL